MSARVLQRKCQKVVRDFDLPRPLTMDKLVSRLEGLRDRTIEVHYMDGLGAALGPLGVWVSGPSKDRIVVEHSTSPLHQEHILLHEMAHMMASHQPNEVGVAGRTVPEPYYTRLFDLIESDKAQACLPRSGADTPVEQEAEVIATLIGERMDRFGTQLYSDRCSPQSAAQITRFASLMEGL